MTSVRSPSHREKVPRCVWERLPLAAAPSRCPAGCTIPHSLCVEAENFPCVYCEYSQRSGGAMTDRYLPVPVWNNRFGQWEPVDFRHGQQAAAWPNGFDLARLPRPEYRDGDRVQFVRDEICAREGV